MKFSRLLTIEEKKYYIGICELIWGVYQLILIGQLILDSIYRNSKKLKNMDIIQLKITLMKNYKNKIIW